MKTMVSLFGGRMLDLVNADPLRSKLILRLRDFLWLKESAAEKKCGVCDKEGKTAEHAEG